LLSFITCSFVGLTADMLTRSGRHVDQGVVPVAELADGRGRQNDPTLQASPQQLDTTPVFTVQCKTNCKNNRGFAHWYKISWTLLQSAV